MLFVTLVDRISDRLPESVVPFYRGCCQEDVLSLERLKQASTEYMASLRTSAVEFLDVETAQRVASGCDALLEWAEAASPVDPQAHLAVHAAVRYFILEEDAEGDESIIGFDDDLQVVEATAAVLGVTLPA